MDPKEVERLIYLANAAIEATSRYFKHEINWKAYHEAQNNYRNFARDIFLT